MRIQAVIESFRVIEEAKRVTRGRKDFFLEFTLSHYSLQAPSIKSIVAIENLEPGATLTFQDLAIKDKIVFISPLAQDSFLTVSFYSTRKKSDFLKRLGQVVAAAGGVVAAAITGNVSTLIAVAAGKSLLDSFVKEEKSKEKRTVEIGTAGFSGGMISGRELHQIPVIAPEKIFVKNYQREDPETGLIYIGKEYLPGNFGIAEIILRTTVIGE